MAEALVLAQLSCLPSFRDLSVCRDLTEGKSNNSCPKEIRQLAECLQVRACKAMLWSVRSILGRSCAVSVPIIV